MDDDDDSNDYNDDNDDNDDNEMMMMLKIVIILITIKLIFIQVRFDHYNLPDDEKASVSDIELTTNVGKLGRWMFRVDGIPLVHGSIFNQGLSENFIRKMVLTGVIYTTIAIRDQWGVHLNSPTVTAATT